MTPRTMSLVLAMFLVASLVAVSPAAGAQVLDPTDTIVYPGESIQEAVDANPEGTHITIATGVHREQQVVPKAGNRFSGESGAILNGSALITEFGRESGLWVIGNQTAEGERDGECEDGYRACIYPEQLLIDDEPLWQVESIDRVEPGTFFFDYAADKVYFADDPNGRVVELSTVPYAIWGDAANVQIRNIEVEKYATPSTRGSINANAGNGKIADGWRVVGVTVRLSAGNGLAIGNNTTVRNSTFVDNARVGIGGGAVLGGLIENNVIDDNCWFGGFACFGWGGGGVKVAGAIGTVFRGNQVNHNNGAGIHSDVWAEDIVIENNTFIDNSGAGAFVEITYGALITGNYAQDNGLTRPDGKGAGIVIGSSPDVEVSFNRLVGNAVAILGQQIDREMGPFGPGEVDNLWVHDNIIDLQAGPTGLKSVGRPNYYETRTITWDNNQYRLGTSTKPFLYGESAIGIDDWFAKGYDRSSAGLLGLVR